MGPDSLHAWFEDWLDACNRHDLEAVAAFLAPDVRRAGAATGAEAWLDEIRELLTGFPDYRWKRIAVVAEGDRVAVHLRTRGTHRGAYRGVRATGRHVGVAAFAILRVRDGRVTEWSGTDDGAALVAQLTA